MKKSKFSLLANYFIPDNKNYLWTLTYFFLYFINPQNTIQAQLISDFTSSGTYTVPPEFTYIKVEAWGGGGGGGGANSLASLVAAAFGGGGGGAGAYNSKVFDVSPSQSYSFSFSVGSGGAGSGSDGANGSATSVSWTSGGGGTLTANGGSGGKQGFILVGAFGLSVTITQGIGGAGGTGGVTGEPGGTATAVGSGKGGNSTNGGAGGNSITAATNVGASGGVPGGGGSGGYIKEPLTLLLNKAGGSGGNGHVRITAYRCNPEAASISTWNGTAWTNGAPTTSKKAIINGNYNTAMHGNITACSCQINTGKTLTIGDGANPNYLELYNEIINNGTIVIANNASLIQWYNTVPNTSTGTVKVYRNAQPMKRYDFTYWSSPVEGQTLHNLSPTTLFDKYFSWTPASGWTPHNYGAATMQAGKGYIVRAPQSFPINTTANFTGIFTGNPNNGDKVVQGFQGSNSADIWNLIGNPYPSAIDINKFLADPENTEVGGTIYLWTHNTPPYDTGSGVYTYTSNDYASYNLSGGVGTAPAQPDPNDPTEEDNNYNNLTNGYIASGQAFFIKGIQAFDAVETASSPIVKFKNSMRIIGHNSNFFKPAPTSPVENWQTTGKHRFWINLRNSQGAFNQALIGYIEDATDGLDRLYDGELFGGNYVSIYSLLDQKKLTIQGKALPFNSEDAVPLGYKVTIAGDFYIDLDQFDGLFAGQNIFIKDKMLNVIHNLKDGPYHFVSAIGTFDNRFEIVYVNQVLGHEKSEIDPESIIIYKNTDAEIVINAGILLLEGIRVFDISGRLIHESKNINHTEALVQNLPSVRQVLILEIKTSEGLKIIRKIVF